MTLHGFGGVFPQVAADAFIAPGAQVIGDVRIGPGASIWYNCVLRGDVMPIIVGARSNIQDGSIVHVSRGTHGTVIGDDCLIGHMAIIHGCTLYDHAFVGLGSVVMDGCIVEGDAMLAAGSLLTPGKIVRAGELWAGRPARPVRPLTASEIARNRAASAGYVDLAGAHRHKHETREQP